MTAEELQKLNRDELQELLSELYQRREALENDLSEVQAALENYEDRAETDESTDEEIIVEDITAEIEDSAEYKSEDGSTKNSSGKSKKTKTSKPNLSRKVKKL